MFVLAPDRQPPAPAASRRFSSRRASAALYSVRASARRSSRRFSGRVVPAPYCSNVALDTFKNRVANPTDEGYRDLLFKVVIGGHMCEVQLHLADMAAVKDKEAASKLYKVCRRVLGESPVVAKGVLREEGERNAMVEAPEGPEGQEGPEEPEGPEGQNAMVLANGLRLRKPSPTSACLA